MLPSRNDAVARPVMELPYDYTGPVEGEVWRFVPGFEPRYDVSNYGRVRTYYKMAGQPVRGRVLTSEPQAFMWPSGSHNGHMIVLLCGADGKHPRQVHRLVMSAFVGVCDERIVRHLNGIPDDNFLSNLTYGTLKENCSDRWHHKCAGRGEYSPIRWIRRKVTVGARVPVRMMINLLRPDNEQWKPIVGFEGLYEVSDRGNVRSLHKGREGCIVAPKINDKGYLVACLMRPGAVADRKQYPIHQLVLSAFVGPCPAGQVTRHLDGHRDNNALSNLVWGTHKENQMDRVRHGTSNRGERCGSHKLTEADVRKIREGVAAGTKQKVYVEEFSVDPTSISCIVLRKTWRHVA